MNKKMCLAALLMVLLCLSACGNNNVVETSDTDSVEEVVSEQSDEISDTVASSEDDEEESVEVDESITADDDGNEISEQNEVENTDETKIEESVTRTECNETVFTNTTSNVRLQPSSSAEKVETVNKGTELLRTAILDNGWSEIQYNGQICYISSKLVNTEPIIVESNVTNLPSVVESNPASDVSASGGIGETKTESGVTFVCQGYTPNGLKIWCVSWDTDGTWPDYMISAYDKTGITNDMSDYDKAVAINNYICKVVDYAEVGVDDRALYSACLTYGKATCPGYAHAFDCLCTMAGVYSEQVGGTAGQNSHTWNYVLIGGTKYWVDVQMNDETNNAFLMSTSQFPGYVANY